MLFVAVLVVSAGLWWFLFNAAATERIYARQRLTETRRGELRAARDRLLRHWLEYLNEIEESVRGLPPSGAFAKIVEGGLADTVIVRGESTYPTISAEALPETRAANREVTDAAAATLEELRQALAHEHWEKALRYASQLEEPAYDSSLDRHGRNIALDGGWLFLERYPDKKSEAYRIRTRRLHERLTDYGNEALPSSQRRFLMHQMAELELGLTFPTLPAEDLAVSTLLSRRVITSSERAGTIWSPLTGLWAAQTGHPHLTLVMKKATLHDFLRAGLDTGIDVKYSPTERAKAQADVVISLPIGATMPGWELHIQPDAGRLASVAGRNTALYMWVGVSATLAMASFAWLISRGLLRESRRAQLKQDLASAVSHELKTPLSSMRVFVDLLLEDDVLDQAKTREYLQLMSRENARLTRLVENFLTFSRLERWRDQHERESIDSATMLRESGRAAQKAFAGNRLKLEIEPGLRPIHGDHASMHSAVMNLLDNACRYSPQETPVTLRGFGRNGDVCVEVEDRGPGLKRSERRKAFSAFDRLSKGGVAHPTGCGLGLYIVRTVVEHAGGRVEVDSQPGSGSTFRLVLPAMKTVIDETSA